MLDAFDVALAMFSMFGLAMFALGLIIGKYRSKSRVDGAET